MNPRDLVADLFQRDIHLFADGPTLIIKTVRILTEADQATIDAHRPALLAYLQSDPTWKAAHDAYEECVELLTYIHTNSKGADPQARTDFARALQDMDALFEQREVTTLRDRLLDLAQRVSAAAGQIQ
jgi:hypothetical protein